MEKCSKFGFVPSTVHFMNDKRKNEPIVRSIHVALKFIVILFFLLYKQVVQIVHDSMCVYWGWWWQVEKLGKLPNETSKINRFNLSLGSLCLGATSIGLTLGWPSNFLSDYIVIDCPELCLDSSRDGSSTVRLVVHFGACIGALVPACVVDILGRRHNFALAGITSILFWSILVFTKNNVSILVGSTIGGFSTGLYMVTVTMYIAEMSSSQRRGIIASLVAFSAYFGILIGSCLSFFFQTRIAPIIMGFLSVAFLITITIYTWMIESPYFLYEQNRTLEAKLALKYLRNVDHILDIDDEYRTIQLFFDSKKDQCQEKISVSWLKLENCHRIWTTIMMILLCCTQITGNYAIDSYTNRYVELLFPTYGKIFLSILDVVSITFCILVIDRVGRRYLLFFSIFGSSISCLLLAADTFIHQVHHQNDYYYDDKYLAALIFVLYHGSISFGLTPLIPLVTGELFPNRIKTIAIGLCISGIYLSAMISQSMFELLNVEKGDYVALISFTLIGSLGMFFIILFLPETHAKTLHEIQKEIDECAVVMI